MSEKLVKSKERVKNHAEVYTPEHIINEMLDLIPIDTWDDIDATFLEPSAGNGNFVVKILERKLARCTTTDEKLRALKSIYAVELLPDNLAEMKARMREILANHGVVDGIDEILDLNIQQGDFLKHTHADGTLINFYDWRGGTGFHSLRSMVEKQQALF